MKNGRSHHPRVAIDALVGAGVCLAALCAYVATLAPGLTWANYGADGGDLIAAAMTGGVPHPTGYPTWLIGGRLIALLPIGSVALRFNLYSALAASAASGVVYAAALALLGRGGAAPVRRLIAAAAAFSLAVGRTLWSQAVITEVYALAALCMAGSLYLALRTDLSGRLRYWAALGLSIGLGLGVHLTLALALPGIALLCGPALRRSPRRGVVAILALLAGLGVYAWVPLAGAAQPPVYWGQPDDLKGFWWLVSGRLYHGYAFGLPLVHLPERLFYWARLWGAQAGWHGLALSLLGGRLIWEEDRRRGTALALVFGATTVYALGYATVDSTAYLIPAFLVAALWTARGLAATCAWLVARAQWPAPLKSVLAVAIICAVAAWPLATNSRWVDASRDAEAREWSQRMVASLPPGALVVTGDDRHTFAMSYVQWAEGLRPDLLVVDGDLWNQPWYAAQVAARSGLSGVQMSAPLADLVRRAAAERPVVLTSWRAEVTEGLAVSTEEGFWVLRGVGGDGD